MGTQPSRAGILSEVELLRSRGTYFPARFRPATRHCDAASRLTDEEGCFEVAAANPGRRGAEPADVARRGALGDRARLPFGAARVSGRASLGRADARGARG